MSSACHCIRLTEERDMTTHDGLQYALSAVQVQHCILWCSIPCTGGSAWNRLNARKYASAAEKVRKHQETFHILWDNFEIVAEACMSHGGHCVIEWPAQCAYWTFPKVVSFLERYGMTQYRFDGCEYGITSIMTGRTHLRIRKPWIIATGMRAIGLAFSRTCSGTHQHAKCEGIDTKHTEGYSLSIAHAFHKVFRDTVHAAAWPSSSAPVAAAPPSLAMAGDVVPDAAAQEAIRLAREVEDVIRAQCGWTMRPPRRDNRRRSQPPSRADNVGPAGAARSEDAGRGGHAAPARRSASQASASSSSRSGASRPAAAHGAAGSAARHPRTGAPRFNFEPDDYPALAAQGITSGEASYPPQLAEAMGLMTLAPTTLVPAAAAVPATGSSSSSGPAAPSADAAGITYMKGPPPVPDAVTPEATTLPQELRPTQPSVPASKHRHGWHAHRRRREQSFPLGDG